MLEQHIQRSELKETMASNYNISIQYNPNNPMATWSIDGKTTDLITAQVGDTLSFNFEMPETPSTTLSSATLFTGPRKPSADKSPFDKNQIPIEQGSKLQVAHNGYWGFSIAFTTTTADGVSSFYFLPDPELEVGST